MGLLALLDVLQCIYMYIILSRMGAIDQKNMNIPRGCKFYEKGLEGTDMPEKKMFKLGTLLKEFGHSEVRGNIFVWF